MQDGSLSGVLHRSANKFKVRTSKTSDTEVIYMGNCKRRDHATKLGPA